MSQAFRAVGSFFSRFTGFAVGPRPVKRLTNIFLGAVTRRTGADYVVLPLSEIKSRPAMKFLFDTTDPDARFVELAATESQLVQLVKDSAVIVESGKSSVQLVDAPSAHYDRVDIAQVQLSPKAAAFIRDPANEKILHIVYLNNAIPLPRWEPNLKFVERSNYGIEGTQDWSINTTVPGPFKLGVSMIDVTHACRVADSGLVVLARKATTQLEHNLGGDRLQVSYLTENNKLGSVVPGKGRHPVQLVDFGNPFVGFATFAPAHFRFAAAVEVLAAGNNGKAWDIDSRDFQQAVNERAYKDNPNLWWIEQTLAIADVLGLFSQYAQIVFGQRTAPALELPKDSPEEASKYIQTAEKLNASDLAGAPPITKEEVQDILAKEYEVGSGDSPRKD